MVNYLYKSDIEVSPKGNYNAIIKCKVIIIK